MKYLKNVLLILLLAVIVFTVTGVSFKIGEKIFFVYKTTFKGPLQENVNQNSKEMPGVAVVPKADEPIEEGAVKSGVNESAPIKKVEPASGQGERISSPVMEKNMVQPAQKVVPPVARGKTEAKPSVERQLPQSTKEEVHPSSSTPIPKVTETETQSTLILAAVVNIRSEPNIKSKIISKLKKGDRVVILSISGDWLNVKLSSGLTGWVFKTLTNMVQSAKKVIAPVAKVEKPVAAAEPEVTAPTVKPTAITSTLREYKVIAGSFSIKANADILMSQLKANNYEPMVVQANTPKGQFYRVIVGSYRSLSETKAKISELKKLGFQPFHIVE